MFAVLNNPIMQDEPTKDPSSLDNLHDVVMSSAPAWWPPATGWYVLAAGLLLLSIWVLIRCLQNYLSNAYRRAALRELEAIRSRTADAKEKPRVVTQLNRLLKRVAMVRWGRHRVAGSSGQDWLEFLNRTAKSDVFTQEQISALRDSAYSSRIREGITDQQLTELLDKTEKWIRSHQVTEVDSVVTNQDEGGSSRS